MNAAREPVRDDAEMRAALREHFTDEIAAVERSGAPPAAVVAALRAANESPSRPSGRRRWLAFGLAAAVVGASAAAWMLEQGSTPQARVVAAIEKHLVLRDSTLRLRFSTFWFSTEVVPDPVEHRVKAIAYEITTTADSRYRFARVVPRGDVFDVPVVAGFDGTSSWCLWNSTVRVAEGDVSAGCHSVEIARYVANRVLREILDRPEQVSFRRIESASSSTETFSCTPRDLGGSHGVIEWEGCKLVVDGDSGAILRGSVDLRIGYAPVQADFEVVARNGSPAPQSFSAAANVPPSGALSSVEGTSWPTVRDDRPILERAASSLCTGTDVDPNFQGVSDFDAEVQRRLQQIGYPARGGNGDRK